MELQIRDTISHLSHLSDWQKLKYLTLPLLGKIVVQEKPTYMAIGSVNWHDHCGKLLGNIYQTGRHAKSITQQLYSWIYSLEEPSCIYIKSVSVSFCCITNHLKMQHLQQQSFT